MASIFDTLQQFAANMPEQTQKAITGAATEAATGIVKDASGKITTAVGSVTDSVQSVAKRINDLDLEGMQEEYYKTMRWAKIVAAFTVGAMTATMLSCYFSYKISKTQERMLELTEGKRRRASNPRRRIGNQHRSRKIR